MVSGSIDPFDHPELRAVRNFGVSAGAIEDYQVLCLPENLLAASSREELVDADDAVDLAKQLREAGVATATSYELTPEAKTIERRGGDLWFGIVWVLNDVALPFFVSVLANMLTGWRTPKSGDGSHNDQKQPVAHIKLRIKRGENYVNIDYSGDGETLVDVLQALKRGPGNKP
jgi:hypothetical protein